jgi:hypothetical protein
MRNAMARPAVAAVVEQGRRRMQNHYEGKDFEEASAPDWVYGCDKCKYGIVNPPDPNGVPAPLYLARAFQMENQRLTLCTCRAGNMYRQYLRKKYWDVIQENDYISPDARDAIVDSIITPTVNGEKV